MKKKILFIITGLQVGGAEMMLYKLCKKIDQSKFEVSVISLTTLGSMGERIAKLDISIFCLDMPLGKLSLSSILQLRKKIKLINPDIVQTWLYHADLIGGVAAKSVGVKNIYWNIRNSDLSKEKSKLHTRLTVKVCAFLSHYIPKKIICNSYHAMNIHCEKGYRKDKFVIIPNGFDLDIFKPNFPSRESVRKELGISLEAPLIGMVGRFDPQKNHQGFITAAEKVLTAYPTAHFLLVGKNVDRNNKVLSNLINKSKYKNNYHLLGLRSDIGRLTAALDVATLTSSWGEAFPNAIGEAMACGIPCVATDVGDVKYIIADTGIVAPVNDMDAVAEAWLKMIYLDDESKEQLKSKMIDRVKANFSILEVVNKYETIYS